MSKISKLRSNYLPFRPKSIMLEISNINQAKSPFNIIIWLIVCYLNCCQMQANINVQQYTIAIQNTNENFTSYLPYIQSCNFNQSGILQGDVIMTQLTDQKIFQYTSYAASVLYFSNLQNGLNIMLFQKNIIQGYNGSIYPIQSNNQTQPNNTIILYDLHVNKGQISLNYAQVNLSFIGGYNQTTTILQTINTTFNIQIKKIIQSCYANGNKIIFGSIDPQIFVGVCQNTSVMFFWNSTNQTQQYNLTLQVQSISPLISEMTMNPNLYLDGGQLPEGWNIMMLSKTNQGYLCNFPIDLPSNYTCVSFQNFSITYLIILSRLWNVETDLQQIKIQSLINQFGTKFQKQFPGNIVSVYIDQGDNVFIESIDGNLSYINVFNWKQQLLLNISFIGDAITFGSKNMVIQSSVDDQFYVLSFQLPLMLMDVTSLNNSSNFFLNISCSDGVENIQINYDIFYSNIQFPSFQGFEIANQSGEPFYSQQQIYSYDLDSIYQVFGPAFDVYIRTATQISVTLIDSNVITINSYIDQLVELVVIQRIGKFVFGGYFSSNNSIYYISQKNNEEYLVVTEPCEISSSLKGQGMQSKGSLLYGFNDEGNKVYCQCQPQYSNCEQISASQSKKLVQQSSTNTQSLIQRLVAFDLYQQNPSYQIKKNIFSLINQQLLVTVFINNTVSLSNLASGSILDSIVFGCVLPNQTDGGVYERQFYDPIIILFCQNSPQVTQYIIRSNSFIFNRIIPLYGFVTTNSSNSLVIGNNFIFLEVDLDSAETFNININLASKNCCVLRLDPFQYTVSVIKEVIFALDIEFVYKHKGLDIAYYSGSHVKETSTFLQVYFDSTWIALNQTQHDTNIQTYSFDVLFSSLIYNFGCIFSSEITYNITNSILKNNNATLPNIELTLSTLQTGQTIYTAQVQFDLNTITGPIADINVFFPTSNLQQIFIVNMNHFITPEKMIMNLTAVYVQIFTPMEGHSGTTLDNLVFVVAMDYMSIYAKSLNDITLFELVDKINLPQTDCKYYTNTIINNNTIVFTTSCQSPNYLTIPLMTVSYFPEQQNNSVIWSFSEQSILFDLFDMYTIPVPIPLAIGVINGPMKSFAGKLCVCSNGQICQFLYVSSSILFLINYDVYIYDNTYLVVTLDCQFIQIFLNIPFPINGTTVQPTYTINLADFISEDVSVVSIVTANSTQIQFVLSGNQTYYQILYAYSNQQPVIRAKFSRYVNCQSYDKFQVYLIQNNSQILGMLAYCGMNKDMLKLWQFQIIDSSSVIINTGYFQLYSIHGPLSSLYTDQMPYFEPIDIFPVSASMINPLFLIYKVDGINQQKALLKIIYQQIDGVLIDCFLTLKPGVTISLQPLTTEFYFPSFGVSLSNDYYQINMNVETSQKIAKQFKSLQIAALGVLGGLNIITILMIIFYFALNHNKILGFDRDRNSVTQSEQDDTQGRKTILSKIGIGRETHLRSELPALNNLRKRSTEIQIFTMRNGSKSVQKERDNSNQLLKK